MKMKKAVPFIKCSSYQIWILLKQPSKNQPKKTT